MLSKIKLRKFQIPELMWQLLLSWLLAVTVEYLLLSKDLRDLSGLDGLGQMSFGRVMAITCIGTLLLWTASRFANFTAVGKWTVLAVAVMLVTAALSVSMSNGFFFLCAGLLLAIGIFALRGWNSSEEPLVSNCKAHWSFAVITGLLALGFVGFVSLWTVSRIRSFTTPTYDFGIFSQMFYNMSQSGLPVTTLERDGLLSHFAVHVSPIYYLMLPFYCLVPRPETLQVLQAVVLASGVIPLWLIGKRHGLSGLQRMLLCAVLLLYPALSGGTSYDLHENCFLTPCILWLFYGIDRKSISITGIAALLTLMVKEDAAVYVAVIALWLIVKSALRMQKKQLLTGVALLAGSLVWFFAVTGYLAKYGDGVMTYRYENFIYDGSSSLITVVKAVIMNPMKALHECVEGEKLAFIAQTMLPLLGIPLLTRRYERYILLIPYVLINLMSDYQYQHNIFFQYTFGSTAFLLYLTAVNLADWKRNAWRATALAAAVLIGAGLFVDLNVPVVMNNLETCRTYRAYYDEVRTVLDTVPEDVSVTTNTYYTSYLSRRQILYDIRYCSTEHLLESEYVVLRPSSTDYKRFATAGKDNGYENVVKLLEQNGYEEHYKHGTILTIFKKAQ